MAGLLIFVYGVISYFVGMAGLIYFMAYMGGWGFLPLHIDSGEPGVISQALLVNALIMLLWAVQHSVMARSGFKEVLTKVIPKAAERSTYVMVSGILMVVICLYWQPVTGTLWHVQNEMIARFLVCLQLSGWLITVASSFMINHFDLFGLKQVYLNFVHKPMSPVKFVDRLLYKVVRHPIQLGMLIGLWSAPLMSATHFMLSFCMTVYIFVGLHFEEKSLIAELGEEYEQYRRRVPMVLPIPKL